MDVVWFYMSTALGRQVLLSEVISCVSLKGLMNNLVINWFILRALFSTTESADIAADNNACIRKPLNSNPFDMISSWLHKAENRWGVKYMNWSFCLASHSMLRVDIGVYKWKSPAHNSEALSGKVGNGALNWGLLEILRQSVYTYDCSVWCVHWWDF